MYMIQCVNPLSMSLTVAGGSGLLALSQEREFSEIQKGWVTCFCMELYPWVVKVPSPSVLPCKTSYFLNRAGVKVVERNCCFMLEHSPNQHQAYVPNCSPLPMIMGLLGTQWIQTIKSKTRGKSDPSFICLGDLYSQISSGLHLLQVWLTGKYLTYLHPNSTVHSPISPFVWSLPPVICRERTSGCSLGIVKLQLLDGHAYNAWPSICSFPLINN